MPAELICQKHGPYTSPDGQCPYCKAERGGQRPAAPRGLDDFTDPGPIRAPAPIDDEATDPGPQARSGSTARGAPPPPVVDDSPTELPPELRRRRRGLDEGEDDHTQVLAATPAREGLLGWLVVKTGPKRGKFYEISDGTTIGRKDAKLVLDDRAVSDPHGKITVEEGKFVIWDFASANGTFVNGQRIRGATPLNENDEIKMGETVLALKVLE